ncbi:MAG: metalloregulator ArsR/SmtB family transcription factor [Pseudomonadota bacterium]
MDTHAAADRFGALAQPTRLTVLRLLVKAGPQGLNAGALAASAEVPASTLSFHLKELQTAGLASSTRQGRQIIYRAHYDGLRDLIQFLLEDCCQSDPAICAPLVETVSTVSCQ